MAEKIDTSFVINTPEGLLKDNDRGCTERIKRLRRISHSTSRIWIWKEQKLKPMFTKSTKVPYLYRF